VGNLYLIQFKVEGGNGQVEGRDDRDDGGDNDHGDGDDNQGFDELDHDLSLGLTGSVGQKKDSKNSTLPSGSCSTPVGSRKVAD
jgi:hypothetical protein